MKLISPIDCLHECEQLLDAGADELYGGYVPETWQQRFGELASINQRTFSGAQVDSYEDLREIVQRAHDRGKEFALTLNSPFYSNQQQVLLVDYVAECADAGVDSVILADLGLLRLLKRSFPALVFHGSTLARLGNSAAIKFYQEQGLDRVILPRHLTVPEMAAIRKEIPEIACDAFLLVGKCPNTEGLCTFHHSSPDKVWPCEIPYQIEAREGGLSEELEKAVLKQQSWSKSNRRHGCGLCAIPALIAAGLDGLKLVGRGAPVVGKVKNLTLAAEFLMLADQIKDFDTYRAKAIAAHKSHFGVLCSENVCYYPEFYNG